MPRKVGDDPNPSLGKRGTRATEAIATREELAAALTALREHAGLTVRQLASRLDVPVATLGDYFSGRHLPGSAQRARFARLLAACGVADPDEVEAWLAALARVRRASDGRAGRLPPPYPGLEPFGEDDAGRFFGREDATGELIGLLRASASGVAVLVGPSGVGKSSLLRAGVLAALRRGALEEHPRPGESSVGSSLGWSAAALTPGDDPLGALEAAVGALRAPFVLVVDQLEEIFAPELGLAARGEFLARLFELASAERLVLLGLRADFYNDAAAEPLLLPVLQHDQLLLGPMDEEALRRAILEPARQVGVAIEDGLVELLLAELRHHAATGAHEPGALPLLSHVLRSTWEHSHHGELTLAAYRDAGGVGGAIAQSAERCFLALTPAEQELARRLFLRLVNVDEDGRTTRRRVRRAELAGAGHVDARAGTASVLEHFVGARLVTVDATTVAISHEALLEAWPRLGSWLVEDRAELYLHHQLASAASGWLESGRDEALLLRGSRLVAVADWVDDPRRRDLLSGAEIDLLEESVALRRRERTAERRRRRRLRQALAASAIFALVAAVLAGVAFSADAGANTARDQARSRQLAIEAEQLSFTNPNLAMQLALAGYRVFPTLEARSTLLDATAGEMPTRLVGPAGPDFVSIDARGRLLAIARSAVDDVELDTLGGARPGRIATVAAGPTGTQVFSAALSPNGRLLAAGGTGGDVVLYDLARLSHPRQIATLGGFKSTVYDVAFSADDDELAAASADGTVRLWRLGGDVAHAVPEVLRAPSGVELKAVALSRNGRRIFAAGTGGTLVCWRDGHLAPERVQVPGGATIESLALAPNGAQLLTGGDDGAVRRYAISSAGWLKPDGRTLSSFPSVVYAVAYSSDGSMFAAADAEGMLRLFSGATTRLLASVRQSNPVSSLAFEPGDTALVSGDGAGVVRIWPLPFPAMVRSPGNVFYLEFSKLHPRLLAAVSSGAAGEVQFWNLASPSRPKLVASVRPSRSFGPVAGSAALSPNGRLLAVADAEARIQLYDVADPRHPRPLGAALSGDTPLVEQLSFSPDSTMLAAGDDGGAIHRWDLTDPSRPVALPTLRGPTSMVLSVAYSPNGKLLAAASADHHVWLYDVARPGHPYLLARIGGFANYVYSVAFSPDGKLLAAGSADETVRLYDFADPSRPRQLGPPLTGPTAYVYQVAFSPDGRQLAAATTDGQVWLWSVGDPSHPVQIATLRAASGSLFSVAFTPSGGTLLAAGTDAVIHRWMLDPAAAASRICELAGTPIRRAEWDEYAPGVPYRPPCLH